MAATWQQQQRVGELTVMGAPALGGDSAAAAHWQVPVPRTCACVPPRTRTRTTDRKEPLRTGTTCAVMGYR